MPKVAAINAENFEELVSDPPIDWAKFFAFVPQEQVPQAEERSVENLAALLPADVGLADVVERLELIRLTYDDGSEEIIYLPEIIRLFGHQCEGYSIYADKWFLYVLFDHAAFQAGALGIRPLQSQEWLFSGSGPELCPQGVVYLPGKDMFVGLAAYEYRYVGPSGQYLFIVNQSGEFQRLDLEGTHVEEVSSREQLRTISFFGENSEFIGVGPEEDAIYVVFNGQSRAYTIASLA